MSDEDALIAAIVTHRFDMTPRLIYADWLDENNQGEKAKRVRAVYSAWVDDWYEKELVGSLVAVVGNGYDIKIVPDTLGEIGDVDRIEHWAPSACHANNIVVTVKHLFVDSISFPTAREIEQFLPALVSRQPIRFVKQMDLHDLAFSNSRYSWDDELHELLADAERMYEERGVASSLFPIRPIVKRYLKTRAKHGDACPNWAYLANAYLKWAIKEAKSCP